jgi:two-component system, cell cycle response regulator DivK
MAILRLFSHVFAFCGSFPFDCWHFFGYSKITAYGEENMGKGRILIVEDNIDNLDLVRFLLEQDDYEVIQARDGRSGMELAQLEQPDLILLDMSIPEVDGWKVARRLKELPSTSKICIVALTAHILPGDRKKALDAGCDGFISKPLDIPNFVEQVSGYLEKSKANE